VRLRQRAWRPRPAQLRRGREPAGLRRRVEARPLHRQPARSSGTGRA